jgi:hypothetical protein
MAEANGRSRMSNGHAQHGHRNGHANGHSQNGHGSQNGHAPSGKPLLKKGEVHKERFEDESERWKEVKGYLIIFFCNALSCVALGLYASGMIDAAQELQMEILFLLFKGVLELVTGKFGWELMLHHTAMIAGFALNQLPSMRCWAFITVHQQLVHVPFAIRALWRLTLPALGYVRTEFSWRRRGLINIFWITWFLIVGYRTPLIMGHCIIGYTRHGMLYPAIAGALLGLTLASLDRAWTKAMWPKPGSAAGPSNDGWHLFWFHVGTRSMFVVGLAFAAYCTLFEAMPQRLPYPIPYPLHFSTSVHTCISGK